MLKQKLIYKCSNCKHTYIVVSSKHTTCPVCNSKLPPEFMGEFIVNK